MAQIYHIADIVDCDVVPCDDIDRKLYDLGLSFGDIAALLTNIPPAVEPLTDQGWRLHLYVGGLDRETVVDLPPFLPRAYSRDMPFPLKGPLAYFRDRLFAFGPLPRTASEWSEIALRIRAFQQPDTHVDRPPVPDTRANDPPSSHQPGALSVQQKYEGLVRSRSTGEPGLLTRYFDANPGMDAQLVPIDSVVATIVALYSIEVLSLLEREGHLRSVLYWGDLHALFEDRSQRLYETVKGALGDRLEKQVLAEWDRKHANDFIIDDSMIEGFVKRFGNFFGRETLDNPQPWHEVLEVPANAAITEIQTAYHRKITQYHPDRVATLGPELRAVAEAHSKEINRAYAEAQRARRK